MRDNIVQETSCESLAAGKGDMLCHPWRVEVPSVLGNRNASAQVALVDVEDKERRWNSWCGGTEKLNEE